MEVTVSLPKTKLIVVGLGTTDQYKIVSALDCSGPIQLISLVLLTLLKLSDKKKIQFPYLGFLLSGEVLPFHKGPLNVGCVAQRSVQQSYLRYTSAVVNAASQCRNSGELSQTHTNCYGLATRD